MFYKKFGIMILKRYIKFRSSIYGRVVYYYCCSFIILFVVFNVVFRAVYVDFFNIQLFGKVVIISVP